MMGLIPHMPLALFVSTSMQESMASRQGLMGDWDLAPYSVAQIIACSDSNVFRADRVTAASTLHHGQSRGRLSPTATHPLLSHPTTVPQLQYHIQAAASEMLPSSKIVTTTVWNSHAAATWNPSRMSLYISFMARYPGMVETTK